MTDTLLQAVTEVARLAADVAQQHFRPGVAVEIKPDGSPVTEADRRAEQTARDWIARRFPDDGILGEEFGERPSATGRRWLIDPVDGTKSFMRGVPLWGTLVAVCEEENVIAGAAAFPYVNEVVSASIGAGCWWNGARCHVSATADIRDATVLTTALKLAGAEERIAGWLRLAEAAGVARTWGDAFGYLLVATGRAEVMVDPRVREWDVAPWAVIIAEAGGVLTAWNGVRTAFGGDAIATNGALALAARELMGASAPQ